MYNLSVEFQANNHKKRTTVISTTSQSKIKMNSNSNIRECASCGKRDGDENARLKTCTACWSVLYCGRICQRAHRSDHIASCKREKKLFKIHQQTKECDICRLPLPIMSTGRKFLSCCGRELCSGCIVGICIANDDQNCPFCQEKNVDEVRSTERIQNLVNRNHVNAIFLMGHRLERGIHGVEQNVNAAMDMYNDAADRGSAKAENALGNAFWWGREGIAINSNRAKYHYENAAIGGNAGARYNLGAIEADAGNMNRARKHYMIAAHAGHKQSLVQLGNLKRSGYATKEHYEAAEKGYKAYVETIKSPGRDFAMTRGIDSNYY